MSNLLWISALVGGLLPHAISVVNQSHWSSGVKSVIAFAACIVAAFVVAYAENKFDFKNIATSLAFVFALAQTSYQGLWKPTGIADAVESTTTVTEPSF